LSAYLDTSILLPTLIAEPITEAVYDYLGAERLELLIRDFAAAEVASALSRLVRMALLTEADASARLADFDAWRAAMSLPVDIGASDARLAYIYVRRFDLALRAPDALHLAIARRLDATLVGAWRPPPGAGSNTLSPQLPDPCSLLRDGLRSGSVGPRGKWICRTIDSRSKTTTRVPISATRSSRR
jgi:predicted nucleic acid-binding protein